jgi:hypothetical protein
MGTRLLLFCGNKTVGSDLPHDRTILRANRIALWYQDTFTEWKTTEAKTRADVFGTEELPNEKGLAWMYQNGFAHAEPMPTDFRTTR